MSDLCLLCKGSGNHVFSGPVFYDCYYCGASGVKVQHGPKENQQGGIKK